MTRHINHRGWIVLESIESDDRSLCVDFFEYPSGGFGFEHFRRDPENESWTPIGNYSATKFASLDHADRRAGEMVQWLSAHPRATATRALWCTRPDFTKHSAALAFAVEAEGLSQVVRTLTDIDLAQPTRCAPWDVKTLLSHVVKGMERCASMVASPVAVAADPDPLVYYRSPLRADPSRSRTRNEAAQRTADRFWSSDQIADAIDAARTTVVAARADIGGDVSVETHWGPVMQLDDYLATRVVELAAHGIDVADALDRPLWMSAQAEGVLIDLFTALSGGNASVQDEGSTEELVRRCTGRGTATEAPLIS